MALKDWKKDKSKNFAYKKGRLLVRVYYYNGNYYSKIPHTPEFWHSSEAAAIKFAKDYMRRK